MLDFMTQLPSNQHSIIITMLSNKAYLPPMRTLNKPRETAVKYSFNEGCANP